MSRWVRDLVLFAAGMLGLIHETISRSSDGMRDPNTQLLIVFSAMVGLPGVLRLDEWMRAPKRRQPRRKP